MKTASTLLRPSGLARLRFIVALLALFGLLQPASAQARLEKLTIRSSSGVHAFEVEVARTAEDRARGLMHRRYMPADRGMLFDFGVDGPVAMWMKDTFIPLDMLFIRKDGTIAYVAENTKPKSLDTIGITEPVLAVLELAGGTAKKKGIRPGDKVYHRIFDNAEDEPPVAP